MIAKVAWLAWLAEETIGLMVVCLNCCSVYWPLILCAMTQVGCMEKPERLEHSHFTSVIKAVALTS